MTVIDLLRLLRKNILLLLLTPIVLAALVIYLTKTPTYIYSSETMLYTGIASGSSVEMDKTLSFFATNTAFDNLINVVKSRETQSKVAIRLLAQHLMLPKADPRYISKVSYDNLRKITPDYIQALVVKSNDQPAGKYSVNNSGGNIIDSLVSKGESADSSTFSFSKLDTALNNSITLPHSINRAAYEQTVKNLEQLMSSSDTNFVYKLLYFSHPDYSIKAISTINIQRIASSDLVKLKYDSDDPGICQQTLALITEVCIQNYKLIKENRSDAVVKYFEYQLKLAAIKLKIGEDKLLKFNEDNNIINYYEQSKAVAVVKETLDGDYNNMQIKLAGTSAAIKRIEEKLGIQHQVQLKSSTVIDKRNQLSDISSKIATVETLGSGRQIDEKLLAKLITESARLKDEIRTSVNDLYNFTNSTDGLPVNKLLEDWISNVILFEDTKAGLGVLADRIKEFQKQYAIYAPAGANIKRIEREISVSEAEYLEILHGLNLAKLKMQDAELSSTIKAVDPPFFPLSPNPTKRKILIIAAALIGFLIVLTSILATEYFDDTLKNIEKASRIIKLKIIGVFPKILLNTGSLDFPFVTNRLLELIIQQIDLITIKKAELDEPRTILFLSSLNNEGKTVTAGNIAAKLKRQGKKVLFLNYSRNSLHSTETSQIGQPANTNTISSTNIIPPSGNSGLFSRITGKNKALVELSSPFLQYPASYLESKEYSHFQINAEYFKTRNIKELIGKNNISPEITPEYIIIELPSILYYSYPSQLVASTDLVVLVCRANRVWSSADQGALENLKKIVMQEPLILLNGIELEVIESVLGDLPKKRSWIRRSLKKLIRFQFNSRVQF